MQRKNPSTQVISALLIATGLGSACTQSYFSFSVESDGGHVGPETQEIYSYQGTPDSRVRLGDRHYVRSVMREAFGPSAEVATVLKRYIDPPLIVDKNQINTSPESISNQISMFGGPCDPAVAPPHINPNVVSCLNRSESQSTQLPVTVPGREALRIQACEEITQYDSPIYHAVALALGAPPQQATSQYTHPSQLPLPTDATIDQAFDLFQPGEVPPMGVKSTLWEVVEEVDKLGIPSSNIALEKWRFLLLTLCSDPHWQVL